MDKNSNINITGKNLLFALLTAVTTVFVLTILYFLTAIMLKLSEQENINFSIVVDTFQKMFFPIFRAVGTCFAPVAFLIAFALLQRFRIKD